MSAEERSTTEPYPDDAEVHSLNERVGKSLRGFLARRVDQLAEIDERLVDHVDAIVDLVGGGKRLRPAFCYWAWRGAGESDCPQIVIAAASLELLQASALIHDDVIDGAATRRGRPATHRRLADLHAAHGWRGSATDFGVGGAILLGDLCLSWCDEMLRTSGLEPDRVLTALTYIDRMRTEVVAGQHLDLVNQASGTTSVSQAMHVVDYKAAKYTVERPLHIGAALAGATPPLLDAYSSYGLPLGEAFQLRDDILGVFGDPQVTGKPVGDDLREGKRTLLVAKTLQAATPAQARRFADRLGTADLDTQGVQELSDIIVETGALAACERLVDELTDTARHALSRAWLDAHARAALNDLADAATRRSG